MADQTPRPVTPTDADDTAAPDREELARKLEDLEYSGRKLSAGTTLAISVIAAMWSLFQLWIASPFPYDLGFGIVTDVPARAIHLSFGFLLCFLIFPAFRSRSRGLTPGDVVIALVATGTALYVFLQYGQIVRRSGILLDVPFDLFGPGSSIPVEAIIGGAGILFLLEATRRAVGFPLVVVCSVFLAYSVFGQWMPDLIAHKGVSLERLIGYQWFGGEAIFGIPIDVSVSFVFLFVLFGALLDRAGAGQYFLNLAFAMVGALRGGPAKASIIASGLTGLISGSSIANVVTTGTFTIPVMRRTGMPAVKAGAIEVAASTNGQMMPPVMGAAAFIIAEFVGIPYFDVVVSAAVPALLSYIALLYISHLEALKLGLVGLPRSEIPPALATFLSGIHFLLPIVVLVYLLMVERWTASSSVFYAIVTLMLVMLVQRVWAGLQEGKLADGFIAGLGDIWTGLVMGARNMINIAIAVAAAGIIVGAVASTGLNNAMVGIVETIAGDNVYALLFLTAILCLILGMGLPTTANYIVVASLMAGVLVEVGGGQGLVLHLIAVHLFVFYFGLLADSTPPVCLAAFAASAISRADPMRTGGQAFLYDIRTAVLPFVFIFNPALLLIGLEAWWQGPLVVFMCLIAVLAFASVTQGWMLVSVKWYEALVLIVVIVGCFRPDFVMDQFSPDYTRLEPDRVIAGEAGIEPGQQVRIHVVRESSYGDRRKIFVLEASPGRDLSSRFGISAAPTDDGRYQVTDVAFMSKAEELGLTWDDYITHFSVKNPDRPPRQLVYPFMLLLLGFVIWSQLRRQRAAAAAA